MNGYVLLHRKLIEWEWYDDHNATRLLVHCLIKANWEQKKWKGIVINPGSFVTSWEKLSIETGLSVQQVRTAMKKMEDSGEVTRKSTNKYQAITLCKWKQLQVEERKLTDRTTNNQQTNNKQVTTTEEREEPSDIDSKEVSTYPQKVYDVFEAIKISFDEKLLPKTEKQKDNWLDTIDKCHRIDKYEYRDIYEIIRWARDHDFWVDNFMSVTKLRSKNKEGIKYITVFELKMKNQGNGKSTRAEKRKSGNVQALRDSLEQ